MGTNSQTIPFRFPFNSSLFCPLSNFARASEGWEFQYGLNRPFRPKDTFWGESLSPGSEEQRNSKPT